MSENQNLPPQTETDGYGYSTDEVKINPFNFGLNAGKCYLTKFEWIPNGGIDGAEQEALDIVFSINGTDRSYRMFPITKAFDKDNNEVTDPNATEFKEAMSNFNARVVHILHCFLDDASIRSALSRPIKDFKDFCQIVMSIMPKTYSTVPLDIFMQYQWNIRTNQSRTYLEVPNSMKYGKWICKAIPGEWTEQRKENPTDNDRKALWYVNEKGEEHIFVKNGWFMQSNFAAQQKTDSNSNSSTQASVAETGKQMQTEGEKKAAAW